MRQAGGGSTAERTSRHTETPSPSGRRTSRMATSGRRAGIRARACAAVPASPTTSMSSSRLEQLGDPAPDDLVVVEQEHRDRHRLLLLARPQGRRALRESASSGARDAVPTRGLDHGSLEGGGGRGMEALPFVDELSASCTASAGRLWQSLITSLPRSSAGGSILARVLGCDPAAGTPTFTGTSGDAVPGFRIVEVEPGRRLVLEGRPPVLALPPGVPHRRRAASGANLRDVPGVDRPPLPRRGDRLRRAPRRHAHLDRPHRAACCARVVTFWPMS